MNWRTQMKALAIVIALLLISGCYWQRGPARCDCESTPLAEIADTPSEEQYFARKAE